MKPVSDRSPTPTLTQPRVVQNPRQDSPPAEVAAGSPGRSSPRSVQHRSSASEHALRSAAAASLLGLGRPTPMGAQAHIQGSPSVPAGARRTSSQASLPSSARPTTFQRRAPHKLSPDDTQLVLTLLADDPTGDANAAAAASPGAQQALAASSSSDPVGHSIGGLSASLPHKAVGQMTDQDFLAIAYKNTNLSGADAERVSFWAATHGVSQLHTLEKLQELLGRVASFPHTDRKTDLLRQVMLRVHALPLQDRPQALSDLRAAVSLLDIDNPLPEVPRLENILRHLNAPAAVLDGEDVANVASAFGITLPDGVAILKAHEFEKFGFLNNLPRQQSVGTLEFKTIHSLASNTAGAAMRGGASAIEVAAKFGITTQDGIARLEIMTIESDAPNTAGAATRAGVDGREVAIRFGITLQAVRGTVAELQFI